MDWVKKIETENTFEIIPFGQLNVIISVDCTCMILRWRRNGLNNGDHDGFIRIYICPSKMIYKRTVILKALNNSPRPSGFCTINYRLCAFLKIT